MSRPLQVGFGCPPPSLKTKIPGLSGPLQTRSLNTQLLMGIKYSKTGTIYFDLSAKQPKSKFRYYCDLSAKQHSDVIIFSLPLPPKKLRVTTSSIKLHFWSKWSKFSFLLLLLAPIIIYKTSLS